MNIKFYISDLHAVGHIRAECLAREVNAKYSNHSIDCKHSIFLSDFYKSNVMVFQRQDKREMLDKMLMAKSRGIVTVYDIDDDLFNVPYIKDFPAPSTYYSNPNVQSGIIKFMSESDAIICATITLAKEMANRRTGKTPIFVMDNAVDVEFWEHDFSDRISSSSKKDHITIGWMASGTHLIDIEVIADVLEVIMTDFKNVHLHLIGWINTDNIKNLEKFKDRITAEDWVNINLLPESMKDFDISIAPLIDIPFNRCKSSIKVLQAGALGIPSIASPLPQYLDLIDQGVDGFIAESNDRKHWLMYLTELVGNVGLRNELGMKMRQKVYDKFDIRNTAVQWIDLFDRLCG